MPTSSYPRGGGCPTRSASSSVAVKTSSFPVGKRLGTTRSVIVATPDGMSASRWWSRSAVSSARSKRRGDSDDGAADIERLTSKT